MYIVVDLQENTEWVEIQGVYFVHSSIAEAFAKEHPNMKQTLTLSSDFKNYIEQLHKAVMRNSFRLKL